MTTTEQGSKTEEQVYKEAKEAAKELLKKNKISYPFARLETIAERENLYIETRETKKYDGKIICHDDCGLITINKNIKETGKRRFVIAHEIGHFIMERQKEQHCIKSDLSFETKLIKERAANKFAAELLMPEDYFRENTKERITDDNDAYTLINSATALFNVTITSAGIRYAEIGAKPIALILSNQGIIKWSVINNNFPYKIIHKNSIIPKLTYAGLILSGNKVRYAKEKAINSRTWFQNEEIIKGKEQLWEQSIKMGNYGSILTILREKQRNYYY